MSRRPWPDVVAPSPAAMRKLVDALRGDVRASAVPLRSLMMSDKIRTPMNAIINMNGLALETDPLRRSSVTRGRDLST